jgi:hypothetical protein
MDELSRLPVCPKSHKTHIKLKMLLGMDDISRQQMLQRKNNSS